MTLWCLKCGEPFDPVDAIHRGRWTLGVDWVAIDDEFLAVTAAEAKALFAVGQGNGRPVNRSFVAEFSCSERAEYPLATLAARLSQLRVKLGSAFPLVTVGEGLSWRDPLSGSEPGTPHGVALEEGK